MEPADSAQGQVLRTLTLSSRQPAVQECNPYDTDFIAANDRLKRNLQRAISIRTISYEYDHQNTEELSRFVTFLQETFPNVHSSPLVKREVVANYSLLFTVAGTDKHIKPYMLAAHTDVVPVQGQQWDYPSFEGLEEDGFIYGRGTIDDKHCVMGILEALEFRLQRGEQLKRTLYIAIGHDEEVSGFKGAAAISQILQSRNVEVEFLLDEGLTVTDGVVPLIKKKVALIGVAEKGFLTVEAVLNTTNTGHSSMPPKHTTIGKLAQGVSRLENNPLPNMFGYGPEWAMFENLAPEMTVVGRVIMSNLWLFHPAISWFMSGIPSNNAMIRTTTAVTKIHGGFKDNVIPPVATATINHRIHPAQSVKEVLAHDYQVLNEVMSREKDKIRLDVKASLEPSIISPHDKHSFGYQTLTRSIRQVFTDVAVTPGLMICNTDTRHYWALTENIYRFAPAVMTLTDLPRYHGINERISVRNYEQVVNFYYHLMLNSDQENLGNLNTHNSEL
ncbi:N-fatty-acyl-amino acid synthase/hydrolase PM20D1-like [Glandiceps talaboti]